MCVVSGFLLQWRSEGRAWPGTNPPKVRPAHVRASASVVSAMVKRTTGAWPIPMTWLRHCSLSQGLCPCCWFTSWKCVPLVHLPMGKMKWPGRNGLSSTPNTLHLGCSYHLHSSHRFLSTLGAVMLLKKKKKLSRSISLSSKFDHIWGAARPHLN